MKRRHIKLLWGGAEVVRGHWHFGLVGIYDRQQGKRGDGLAISVRGLLLWSLALALVAYLGGTLVLASFWQRNPYALLTYQDALLYPLRRAEVAQKKGRAFIAEGSELCKIGKWQDGARLLTRGLQLDPRDLRARLTLAQFYVAMNQRAIALETLNNGLTVDFPGRPYLAKLFEVAEQSEDFDCVIVAVDRYLPMSREAVSQADRRWLSAKKFTAMLSAQKPTEALAFAEKEGPGEMSNEHRVLALLELRRGKDAMAFLDEWGIQPGADRQQIIRLKARASRESGEYEKLERLLAELRSLTPGDPRTAVYAIVQSAMAGRDESARVAMDDFFFRYGGVPANVTMLAEPLAEIGQRALLERCATVAAEQGRPMQPFRVLLVQAMVQRGEWEDAAAELAKLYPTAGRVPALAEKVWLEWMQALIDAASTPRESAQTALMSLLRDRPWLHKVFRTTISALRRAGRRETTRDVIAVAIGAFPASAWLRTQQQEVTRELAESAKKQSGGLEGGPAMPRENNEKEFFKQLDDLLQERAWDRAQALVRAQRNLRPTADWFEARDAEVRLADVRIGQGQGDVPAMLAAARIYLAGNTERARRMTDVAQEFFKGGDRSGALALIELVVRSAPDFAPAQKLVQEWKSRPPAATKDR